MRLLEGQFWHLLCLALLLIGVFYFPNKVLNASGIFNGRSLFGVDTIVWYLIAIAVPILHQLYVLLCWRLQLHYQFITKLLGTKSGYRIYKQKFLFFMMLRLLSLILLCLSNTNTLGLDRDYSFVLRAILLIPIIYLLYSVKKHFGVDRVIGEDHFQPQKYRSIPFVRRGIFRYTPNAMYVFGFLLLWWVAILFDSLLGLIVALFSHLYIWVHYYFTELPDIKHIYRSVEDRNLIKRVSE